MLCLSFQVPNGAMHLRRETTSYSPENATSTTSSGAEFLVCCQTLAGVFGAKEFLAVGWAWFDGSLAFLPVGGTNFAIGFEELQRLDRADRFINAAAEGQIVDHLMADNAFLVNQEQSAKGNAATEQNVIALGNALVQVCDQWVANLADAAFFARRVPPGEMREVAVDRNANHLHAEGFEFGNAIRKRDDFGRANEGEVERVEKEQHILALVVGKAKVFFELTIGHDGGRFEIGRRLGNENSHRTFLVCVEKGSSSKLVSDLTWRDALLLIGNLIDSGETRPFCKSRRRHVCHALRA